MITEAINQECLRLLSRVYRKWDFDKLFFYALYLIDMLILSSPN